MSEITIKPSLGYTDIYISNDYKVALNDIEAFCTIHCIRHQVVLIRNNINTSVYRINQRLVKKQAEMLYENLTKNAGWKYEYKQLKKSRVAVKDLEQKQVPVEVISGFVGNLITEFIWM
jgi:hypothetical protein